MNVALHEQLYNIDVAAVQLTYITMTESRDTYVADTRTVVQLDKNESGDEPSGWR
jgi:hypothetical protein